MSPGQRSGADRPLGVPRSGKILLLLLLPPQQQEQLTVERYAAKRGERSPTAADASPASVPRAKRTLALPPPPPSLPPSPPSASPHGGRKPPKKIVPADGASSSNATAEGSASSAPAACALPGCTWASHPQILYKGIRFSTLNKKWLCYACWWCDKQGENMDSWAIARESPNFKPIPASEYFVDSESDEESWWTHLSVR